MRICSKREFYRLWQAGVLGNRTLLSQDLREILAFGSPMIGFREIRASGAGAGAWERGPREQAKEIHDRWRAAGRNFIMDTSVPNERSVMQGEVCRTFRGLESYLALGYGLPPMRESMAQGMHRHRGYVETHVLLTEHLDPSSRDDLDALLELYPDATIELTVFDIDVGVIPGRNTIFWETRDY